MTANHLLNEIMHSVRRLVTDDGTANAQALLDRLTVLSIRLSQVIGSDESQGETDLAALLGHILREASEARTELFAAQRRILALEAALALARQIQIDAEARMQAVYTQLADLQSQCIGL